MTENPWVPGPWFLGPLSPFDLESTGVNAREARIVTGYVSTVLAGTREVVPGAHVIVNPGVPIPSGASAVHGITDEVAQAKGCLPADGLYAIAEALRRSLLARIPVIGFNIAYDFALLHWELLRYGLPTIGERLGRSRDDMFGPVVDAHVLDKFVDPYVSGTGQRKLEPTCARWGVPMGKAHTADADALAAAQLAVVIVRRTPSLAGLDLRALYLLQREQRAVQAASLQAYFRGKGGRPDAFVDPCWPMCVDQSHPTT